MSVRAKFKVTKLEVTGYNEAGEQIGNVHLAPVVGGSPENESFFRWTPHGGATIGTVNAEAFKKFKVGRDYYVDFTDASPVEKSAE